MKKTLLTFLILGILIGGANFARCAESLDTPEINAAENPSGPEPETPQQKKNSSQFLKKILIQKQKKQRKSQKKKKMKIKKKSRQKHNRQ